MIFITSASAHLILLPPVKPRQLGPTQRSPSDKRPAKGTIYEPLYDVSQLITTESQTKAPIHHVINAPPVARFSKL